MRRLLPIILLAFAMMATSAPRATAETITLDPIRSGDINVSLLNGSILGRISVSTNGGFNIWAISESGNSGALCQPCVAGETISLSSSLSGPFYGTVSYGGRDYTLGVNDGGGWLDLTAGSLLLPPSPIGVARFTSRFTMDGMVFAPSGPAENDFFNLSGRGTVRATFNVLPVANQYQLSSLVYQFEDPAAVPEPASLTLLGTGLAGLLFRRRRSAVSRNTGE